MPEKQIPKEYLLDRTSVILRGEKIQRELTEDDINKISFEIFKHDKKIRAKENEKRRFVDPINEEIRGIKEEKENLYLMLDRQVETMNMDVALVADSEEGVMHYYNIETGDLVKSRKMTPDEYNKLTFDFTRTKPQLAE
jgi:hypothetical protein